MLDDGSSFLVDEGYVLVVDDVAQEIGCLGEEKTAAVLVECLDCAADLVEQHEGVEVLPDGCDVVEVGNIVVVEGEELAQHRHELVVHYGLKGVAALGGFLEPFVRLASHTRRR